LGQLLTGREKRQRLESLRTTLLKFKQGDEVSHQQVIHALEDVAVTDFNNVATQAERDSLIKMCQQVLAFSFDDRDGKVLQILDEPSDKQYQLTQTVTLHLTRELHLAKIEILHPNQTDTPTAPAACPSAGVG
jgi:hypothetical protein